MHGDGNGIVDDTSSDEEGDEEAPDWEEAATTTPRPMPCRIPHDLRRGDRIVVYFSKPHSAWYVGVIDKVDNRCKNLPVFATFEDGPSRLCLDADMYGVTGGKQWALLEPIEEPVIDAIEIDDSAIDDSDENDGGESVSRRRPRHRRSIVEDDDDE